VTPSLPITEEPEFFNRELSWLAFNNRVLEEAANEENPLLERVKFSAIAASNLDEFFMVRVAALKHTDREGDTRPDPSGLSPRVQLAAIASRAHEMVDTLSALVTERLLPALAAEGIHVRSVTDIDVEKRSALTVHFNEEILPTLTPLAIDAARPFPMLASLSLNLVFCLSAAPGEEAQRLAVVQVPTRMSRLVRVVDAAEPTFVLLEELIRAHAAALSPDSPCWSPPCFGWHATRSSRWMTKGGNRIWTPSRRSCVSVVAVRSSVWTWKAASATRCSAC
jgi:polyphosphate kinase